MCVIVQNCGTSKLSEVPDVLNKGTHSAVVQAKILFIVIKANLSKQV